MNRFKCPACGGNQYTSADTAEGCIYCGHKELKKMEILEPKEGDGMREIKFRGKRLDNGKWVYGYLLEKWANVGHPQKFAIDTCMEFYENGWDSVFVYEVDPSSVGQYTGLKDKNGKEIYEGDIVQLSDTNPVLFRADIVLARGGYKFVLRHLDDGTIAERYFLDKCKVVGSVWDNPELLKED